MNEPDLGYIPKHLDTPEKFLIWNYDQLGVFMFGFLIGNQFADVIQGIIVGLLLAYVYTKLVKQGIHPQFYKHLLYWVLPREYSAKLKKTPPTDMRRFIN